MNDQEFGTCTYCNKQTNLIRKYYYYPIQCACCVGDKHFQYVAHCEDCTPRPPILKVVVDIKSDI